MIRALVLAALLLATAAGARGTSTGAGAATAPTDAPGVTDSEIAFGTISSLSGPVPGLGTSGPGGGDAGSAESVVQLGMPVVTGAKQRPQMVAAGIQVVHDQELPLSNSSYDSAARGWPRPRGSSADDQIGTVR